MTEELLLRANTTLDMILEAAVRAQMSPLCIEVLPDGTVRVSVTSASNEEIDEFAQWEDKL